MLFPSPLARGTLVSRYKRFFADVALDDGTEITAHCPNPGAMLGLNTPGLPAYVSVSAAVPEPTSWALMLVGFGGLGAVLRRQRRAVAATA